MREERENCGFGGKRIMGLLQSNGKEEFVEDLNKNVWHEGVVQLILF